MFAAGAWLVVFLLLFNLLLHFMDDGQHYFVVASVFILMFLALFMMVDSYTEESTGEGIVQRIRRRRSVPKQHRNRVR